MGGGGHITHQKKMFLGFKSAQKQRYPKIPLMFGGYKPVNM
jgi:hypothetical protein